MTSEESKAAASPLRPALYLIPSTMSDASVSDVIPERNLAVLRAIRHFVVENVRTVRRFLKRCDRSIDIDSLSFTVLDEHTAPTEVSAMLAPLRAGEPVGVISEAGCPAVADPGADLVGIAQAEGLEVVPLVGPSSILLSLMGSGFNGQTFAFRGYLPYESKARSLRLRDMERRIRQEGETQIFIETPYRNNRLIEELSHTLPGNLLLCVASDITGTRQNISTRYISQWAKGGYDYSKTPTIFLLFS